MSNNYNFYQSTVRTHINADIFAKPAFYADYKGISYQVICKEKRIFGIIIVRFQVLGIDDGVCASTDELTLFREAIIQGAKHYYHGKPYIALYIQFGFTDILVQNKVVHIKTDEPGLFAAYEKLKISSDNQKLSRGLQPSRKHNLPDSTIIIDVSKSSDELRNEIGRNTKDKIKKADKLIHKGELSFSCSNTNSDYDLFFNLYCKTAGNKGFGAISSGMWERLKKSALDEGFAKLFLIKDNSGVILSAAFCIEEKNNLIYVYGANDRSYGNAGISQYLHRNIILYAKENNFHSYDFLGASALGSKHDRLEQVTQFKLGFGGNKIEYAGSRDLILSKVGYYFYSLV